WEMFARQRAYRWQAVAIAFGRQPSAAADRRARTYRGKKQRNPRPPAFAPQTAQRSIGRQYHHRRRPPLPTGEQQVCHSGTGSRLSLGPQRQPERDFGARSKQASAAFFFPLNTTPAGSRITVGWCGGAFSSRG